MVCLFFSYAPHAISPRGFIPQIFELLTGGRLFDPRDGGDHWSREEDHLAKMLELGDGQRFEKCLWGTAKAYGKYFDPEGEH